MMHVNNFEVEGFYEWMLNDASNLSNFFVKYISIVLSIVSLNILLYRRRKMENICLFLTSKFPNTPL